MTRKQKNKIRAEKNRISNLIPYEVVYEDGMVKVGDREYIKAYFIEESTYEDIKNVSADEISSKFYKILESLSGRFSIQFLVYNSLVDKSEFLKKPIIFISASLSSIVNPLNLEDKSSISFLSYPAYLNSSSISSIFA